VREYDEDEDDLRGAQPTEVDQQARLPSVRDPKLYLVKVKLGKERETVICLMQKAKSMLEPGMTPLDILSAASQDHLKGFIYIEADRKPHVRAALKGLRNVYHSFEPQLVPIPEMVPSISVVNKAVAKVSVGSWVRMRAGVYKGDLARVLSVSTADNTAVVRLVPRFDLAALATAEARRGRGDPAEKAEKGAPKKARPPQRLFSAAEANIHGLPVEERRDRSGVLDTFELLAGVHKFKDGYYIRSVALTSCKPEPSPPFDELQRFAGAETAGAEGADASGAAGVAALAASLGGENAGAAAANGGGGYQGPAIVFAPGDMVIVISPGDLHNLTGVVESVAAGGEEVRVAPKYEEMAGMSITIVNETRAR
jgi:transcription elongation factor SPT5